MNRILLAQLARGIVLGAAALTLTAASLPRTGGGLVVAPSPNRPPVVSSPDYNATLSCNGGLVPANLLLSGTATDDGKPFGIVIHEWSLIGGDASKVQFQGNRFARQVWCRFSAPGDYELIYAAADGQFRSEKRVKVRVTPPIATVPSGPAISGTVTAGAAGVSGATVELIMNNQVLATAFADGRGRYSFQTAFVGSPISIRARSGSRSGITPNCAYFDCNTRVRAQGCNVSIR